MSNEFTLTRPGPNNLSRTVRLDLWQAGFRKGIGIVGKIKTEVVDDPGEYQPGGRAPAGWHRDGEWITDESPCLDEDTNVAEAPAVVFRDENSIYLYSRESDFLTCNLECISLNVDDYLTKTIPSLSGQVNFGGLSY